MKQKRILIVGVNTILSSALMTTENKIADELDSLKEMGMEDIGSVPAPRLLERFPVDDTHCWYSLKPEKQKRRERRKKKT